MPVLLALGPHWCPGTAGMMEAAYADPAVADLVRDRFVPVRVDPDARPDVGERYCLGGWPTTAFLTPDGDLLGGENYATPRRLQVLLPRVAEAFAAQRAALAERRAAPPALPAVPPGAGPDAGVDAWLADHLRAEFDPEHGGFGAGPKRVQAAALDFAARRARAGEPEFARIVDRTLAAMAWGGLYDHEGGGVFRYCARRDWTAPATEKLLEVNAAALGLFLARVEEAYRERAADLIGYVGRTLLDAGAGGFFASQRGDPAYYGAAGGGGAASGRPPPVDRTVYADATAAMARVLAQASVALGDASLLDCAVRAVERVVAGTYERGGGVAHEARDPSPVRGLLADQVRASAALLDLHALTDREAYLDVAQELMHFAIRRLWDTARGGGFLDRIHGPDDVGLLREPLRPFAANCEAASVLLRLARITGSAPLRERAESTLAAQAPVARAHGVDAAPYALALGELNEPEAGG